MSTSEKTNNVVAGCAIFLAILLVITNFHIQKRYGQLAAPSTAQTQAYVISHDNVNKKFRIACALLTLPIDHQGPSNLEVKPNNTLQGECMIQGEADIETITTVTPYVADTP
jgi:hypothetical protein